MAVPFKQTAFITGEVSPSLFGHTDLARMRSAASTMRNMFVSYRGGSYSRAGTKFVGFSKQTGRSYPPRMISFQFSINQGLALEFGHQYMRVVLNGEFVTENPSAISGATRANPCVLTVTGTGALSATPINTNVTVSYSPGDSVTLAGGFFTSAAVLGITNTKLISLGLNAIGNGFYAPADTIHLTGGTQTTPAVLTVVSTQVVSATVAAAGAGAPLGVQVTVTGTTGTGVKFQAQVQIDAFSGGIFSVLSIIFGGSYTVNPTSLVNEPVTGGGLVGAALSLQTGVLTFSISNPGVFTANAAGGTFTQASTSGTGTGATFKGAIFGPNTVTVSNAGVYATFPSSPVSQASTTGVGVGVEFTMTTQVVAAVPYSNGDWVEVENVGGMAQLNGETFVVHGVSGATFQLFDVYGNSIDSTAYGVYTSGGTTARIYTLSTIYAEQDLKYLKFTESADDLSLCCVNQETLTEYPAQDLSRLADDNWVFTPIVPGPSVTPPTGPSGSASSGGSTDYQYVITSVSPDDGTESVASDIAEIDSAVDISSTAGTISIVWTPVAGINEYNVYKASPGIGTPPPVGSLFGFAGKALGTQFIDSNIVADFTQVPPLHKNPFARGQILEVRTLTGGSGNTTITFTITTATGSGAMLQAVIVGGIMVAVIVVDAGENYQSTDTVVCNADGVPPTASLVIGPQSGTYPSVPGYFQERRAYANTLNEPDTYFMSQPGAFTNFDSRIPTIDTDAVIGAPWSVQVNGIQFMVQTSGGLLVFTGLSAWLLAGTGTFATNVQVFSPSNQVANPQPFTGCSPTVPPIKINYDAIYVTSKGSFYFDLPYQLYALSEPIDLTQNSSHLFTGFTVLEHAWCEQPYKLVWSVRDDGSMLSLTWLKAQEVSGWARHDTNGLFKSVCSVTEPPVDALYLAVQRYIESHAPYMIERMDNRIWSSVYDTWCVDCGLTLPPSLQTVAITADTATGLGAISGVTGLVGGQGYSAGTVASVVDDNGNGPGTGATINLTIAGGVITAAVPGAGGTKYINPKLVITDPTNSGSGASGTLTLNNLATFTAASPLFSSANIGNIIRMGGGVAAITSIVDNENVHAQITSPITAVRPNSGGVVEPQSSWSLAGPVSSIGGLKYLAGATVTGLADGNVIPPVVVPANGIIALPTPSTAVTVGLAFQAQLQSVYLETGDPTSQGQRKKIAAVTARIEVSRGLKAGSNQPDGSVQSPPQLAMQWDDLSDVPDVGPNFPMKPYNATAIPLRTGDIRVPVSGGYQTNGQVCFQQDNPLPMQILAIIPEDLPGDTPQLEAKQRRGGQ